MEQTITPEFRQSRIETARLLAKKYKQESKYYREEGGVLEEGFAIERDAWVNTIEFLLDEIETVRQEALAQGWAACEKEVVYKGHYFNECNGWLHVDMKDITNPHRQ